MTDADEAQKGIIGIDVRDLLKNKHAWHQRYFAGDGPRQGDERDGESKSKKVIDALKLLGVGSTDLLRRVAGRLDRAASFALVHDDLKRRLERTLELFAVADEAEENPSEEQRRAWMRQFCRDKKFDAFALSNL
mmetsp:Transcript_13832/g.45117  ORF Transcript_13832/g.45117 Transcript_13832/m.45117 type:complete len:134 (+) Transcript_13832:1031-1432(+)